MNTDLSIDRLVVIGGGTMGRGIAAGAAHRGIDVLLIEKDAKSLKVTLAELSEMMDRKISRWAMTESEKKASLSRIKGSTDYTAVSEESYIIESIPEDLEAKKDLFRKLDKNCKNDNAIFITNTSTLSITELGSVTNRPERVIGMHFLNPVENARVVEVVRGLHTSSETIERAYALAERLEHTAIEVYESPGYVTTRVVMPMVNEAMHVLMEGVASAEDIDIAIKLGYELPKGPLAMADLIGLDLVLSWLETLFHELGDQKYRPCPLLRMLVRAGNLGVKTGKGFFRYDGDGNIIPGSGQSPIAYQRFLKSK